jgi:hypothetical protein
MALTREQIEHFEYWWNKSGDMKNPWRKLSHSRKWLKKQVNKYLRIKNKHIDEDDIGYKQGKKPLCGWEY